MKNSKGILWHQVSMVLICSLIICFTGFFSFGESAGDTQPNRDQPRFQAQRLLPEELAQLYVPGQVVIKLDEGAMVQEVQGVKGRTVALRHPEHLLLQRFNAQITSIQQDNHTPYYVAATRKDCDIEALCRELKKDPVVLNASPNYYAVISATTPDDQYFPRQYSLRNTGQVYDLARDLSGASGSDIKAVGGWDWTTGSESITIAIVDSGICEDHEDLRGKVVPGYNFVEDSYNTDDDNGHGTFVASLAAANTNNGTGIAGVCWQALLMPVKSMRSDGGGTYLAIAAGIRYAAAQGAQVINLSVGGSNPSFILEEACQDAYNQGAVIVCCSGNSNAPVLYPAAYDDYCLAVAATNANDVRAPYSNYGPQVDVAAPGTDVLGANYDPWLPTIYNAYTYGWGTSFATPHVSGAAALLLSYKPFLTNAQVMDLIRFTADDVNAAEYPGVDEYLGYGRINLERMLAPYEL